MNIRLQQLITAEGLNNRRFAEKMGIQSSNVSHIVNGRNKPGYDFIARMLEVFPNINPYWLILGNGGMYKEVPLDDESNMAGIDGVIAHNSDHSDEYRSNSDSCRPSEVKSTNNSPYTDKAGVEDGNQIRIKFENQTSESQLMPPKSDPSPNASAQISSLPNLSIVSGENIDQIVVFYTDGTFKTYQKR